MRAIIICLLVSICSISFSQETKFINHQNQAWFSINSSSRITEHFGLIGDFHIRRNDFLAESNFYFARLGGAFWITDRLTLVGGVAHLWLSQELNEDVWAFQNENRIYQQIQWRQQVGRVTFVQRIRNEQRWHGVLDNQGQVDRWRFSNRVRFLSSFSIKVSENPKMPSIVFADEVHMHFGKEIIYNTFDQNRIFGGLKVPITSNLKFDIGYMMVYQQKYSGFNYDMNHTFRFFFYYSPDFRKNKERIHYPIPGDE
ncbi:MAG: DUF2490 domain-containing protein [Bacteroidia bacterium]